MLWWTISRFIEASILVCLASSWHSFVQAITHPLQVRCVLFLSPRCLLSDVPNVYSLEPFNLSVRANGVGCWRLWATEINRFVLRWTVTETYPQWYHKNSRPAAGRRVLYGQKWSLLVIRYQVCVANFDHSLSFGCHGEEYGTPVTYWQVWGHQEHVTWFRNYSYCWWLSTKPIVFRIGAPGVK